MRARELQAAVRRVKASREMEAKYMLLEEMLQDEREAGRVEGRAGIVLELLEDSLGNLPEDLRSRILSEKDGDVLKRYLKLAKTAASLDEFMQKISE